MQNRREVSHQEQPSCAPKAKGGRKKKASFFFLSEGESFQEKRQAFIHREEERYGQ